MSKSRFDFDFSEMADSAPVLSSGAYAATIVNPSIASPFDKLPSIRVEEKRDYVNGEYVSFEPKQYHVVGMITYGVVITSKKAIKILARDEPRIYGGQIRLQFDSEKDYKIQDNPALKSLIKNLGLSDRDWRDEMDYYDEDVVIPEELSEVPHIEDMLQCVAYYNAYFSPIIREMALKPCIAVVKRKQDKNNPDVVTNILDMGSWNAPACGILPYKEGCEEDL